MAYHNKVTLMGNLTRDIEIKQTNGGKSVGSVGMAINRKYTTESGEKREEVTFVDLTIFGKQAETLAQYTKKGSQLFVEGRLKLDSWDDKATGAKRSKLHVIVEEFQFLGSKDGGAERAPARQQEPGLEQPSQSRGRADRPNVPEDDIPF